MGIAIKKKSAPAPEVKEEVKHSTPVKATVTKQHPDGSEEQTQETLGEVKTVKHPALVYISMGMTKNLGDYNSMKFQVGITLPCEATPDEVEATYAAGREWVDGKVNEINAEVDALLN